MANEDLLLRQMPHSLEGEQAVLGSMLIDPECIKDVMDKLQPGDFYLRQNREIFETIYSMFSYARPVDGITVAEEMQRNGTYDERVTRNYLVQLMEVTPTQLRQYKPATASSTLKGIHLEGFCLRKIPMMGTIMMYMAVKKADFPASVSTIPSCCKLVARNSGMPQRRPVFHSSLFFQRAKKLPPFFCNRSATKITGSSPITARPHRNA